MARSFQTSGVGGDQGGWEVERLRGQSWGYDPSALVGRLEVMW